MLLMLASWLSFSWSFNTLGPMFLAASLYKPACCSRYELRFLFELPTRSWCYSLNWLLGFPTRRRGHAINPNALLMLSIAELLTFS